jgi:hypothetical protein
MGERRGERGDRGRVPFREPVSNGLVGSNTGCACDARRGRRRARRRGRRPPRGRGTPGRQGLLKQKGGSGPRTPDLAAGAELADLAA